MNLDELRKKYEKDKIKSSGGDNDKWLSLEEGEEVTTRILPFGEGIGDFFFETGIHYINDDKYACPRKTPSNESDDCPICDAYFRVWDDINALGGKDNPEAKPLLQLQKGLRPSSRYYFNVVDRRDGKVKLLSQGFKIYTKIMDTMFDEDFGVVHDVNEGWDFKIKLEKVDGYNNFDKSKFRPKATKAGTDAEIATWLDERHDLNDIIKNPDYEELKLAAEQINSVRVEMTQPSETEGMEETSQEGMSDEEFANSLKD